MVEPSEEVEFVESWVGRHQAGRKLYLKLKVEQETEKRDVVAHEKLLECVFCVRDPLWKKEE